MSSVKLETVRAGASQLGGLVRAVASDWGHSSATDAISDLFSASGLSRKTKKALESVEAYAMNKYGTNDVSTTQYNKALADYVKFTVRADANGNKKIDPSERAGLASTWKAVMAAAIENRGRSIEAIRPDSI